MAQKGQKLFEMTTKFKYICSRLHTGSAETPGMLLRGSALYAVHCTSLCVTRETLKGKALVWPTLVLPDTPRNYRTEEGDRPGIRSRVASWPFWPRSSSIGPPMAS